LVGDVELNCGTFEIVVDDESGVTLAESEMIGLVVELVIGAEVIVGVEPVVT
jgi:hypothetical protein